MSDSSDAISHDFLDELMPPESTTDALPGEYEPDEKDVSAETKRHIRKRYRFCNKLGSGGEGTVYRVKSKTDHLLEFAVKVASDKGTDRYFETEYTTLLRTDLPKSRVGFKDACIDKAGIQNYLVIEIARGRHIDKHAESLDIDSRVILVERLCRMVAQYHEISNPLLLGDFKPSHVFVDACGEFTVVDFGGCKDATRRHVSTTSRSILDTTGYACPSLLTGETPGPTFATDLNTVARIGFKILTGRGPYSLTKASWEKELAKIDSLSPELQQVILRGLIDPFEEEHGDELFESLTAFADAIATARREVEVRRRRQEWASKRRTAVFGASATVAVMFLSLALTWASDRANLIELKNNEIVSKELALKYEQFLEYQKQLEDVPSALEEFVATKLTEIVEKEAKFKRHLRDDPPQAEASIDDAIQIQQGVLTLVNSGVSYGLWIADLTNELDSIGRRAELWLDPIEKLKTKRSQVVAKVDEIKRSLWTSAPEKIVQELKNVSVEKIALGSEYTEATHTDRLLREFEEIQNAIPESIKTSDEYRQINQWHSDASKSWAGGELGAARDAIGNALQALKAWQPADLSNEESAAFARAVRVQLVAFAILMEESKQQIDDLKLRFDQEKSSRTELQSQLAKQAVQNLKDREGHDAAIVARDRAEMQKDTATSDLAMEQARGKQTAAELAAEKRTSQVLSQQLKASDGQLQLKIKESGEWKSKAEGLLSVKQQLDKVTTELMQAEKRAAAAEQESASLSKQIEVNVGDTAAEEEEEEGSLVKSIIGVFLILFLLLGPAFLGVLIWEDLLRSKLVVSKTEAPTEPIDSQFPEPSWEANNGRWYVSCAFCGCDARENNKEHHRDRCSRHLLQ